MKDTYNAEVILEKVFTLMQELYAEMSGIEKAKGNHKRAFGIFADLGRTLVNSERASFWYWDKIGHRLKTAAATDTSEIVIDENSGLVGEALRENKVLMVNDPKNSPNFNADIDKERNFETKSVLVMPVSNCKGEVIGAFQAINKLNEEGLFKDEDIKRLSLAAIICGMALESELFLAISERDRLTGLKNRFGFDDDSENRYEPALKNGKPVSVIICDIDFFKKVNDTYGHKGGDMALIHTAKILQSAVRSMDSVYRWGGEEFIVMLEGMAIEEAVEVAERIRGKIEASPCRFEDKAIKYTMSFGCAAVESNIMDAIKQADGRLYTAKNTGRNKVVAG